MVVSAFLQNTGYLNQVMTRFKKQIYLGLLLGLAVLIFLPSQTHGFIPLSPSWLLEKGFGYLLYFIGLVVSTIAAQFFAIAGAVVDFFLDLNQKILQSPFVLSGFNISLAVANLGFVLALILVAFATILNMEGYGMRQTLRNLIIAAVLVNFSLTIAGVILDFTGVLGEFFMSQIADPNKNSLATVLADVFLINTLQKPPSVSSISSVGGALENILNLAVSLIFTAIFTFLGVVVMLAVGVLYFGRYLIISVLLVLMPLAWLFWVLPGLGGKFHEWWSAFLKWAFFLPASSFFFYITVLTLKNINAYSPPQKLNIALSVDGLMKMVLALGFVSGAVIVADKMSLAGASGLIKTAKNMRGWALGKIKQGGKWTAQKGARTLMPEKRAETVQEKISGLAGKVKIPGLRGLAGLAARGISGAVAGGAKFGGKDAVKDAEKAMKDMSTEQIKAVMLAATDPEKAAALKVLTERVNLDKIDVGKYNSEAMKSAFEAMGESKAFSEFQKGAGMSVKANGLMKANTEVLSSVGGKLQTFNNAVTEAGKALSEAGTDQETERAMNVLQTTQDNLTAFQGTNEHGKYQKTVNQIGQAQAEFLAGFTDEDRDKPQWGNIYSNKDAFGLSGGLKTAFQQATSMGVASGRPGMMPRIAPKLKSDEFDNYQTTMSGAIGGLTGDKQKIAEKSFKRTLDRRAMGIEPGKKKEGKTEAAGEEET